MEKKRAKKRILIGIISSLFLILGTTASLISSLWEGRGNPEPTLTTGVLDFKNAQECQNFSLSGEAYFVPGSWIGQSQESEPEASQTASLPGNMDAKGEIASLYWRVQNVPEDCRFRVNDGNIGISYRLYLDGNLFYEFGDLESERFSSPFFALSSDSEKTNRTASVHEGSLLVMEIGASKGERIALCPKIQTGLYRSRGDSARKAVIFFFLGIGIALTLASLLYLIFSSSKSQGAFLLVCLLLALGAVAFSPDGVAIFWEWGIAVHPGFGWKMHSGLFAFCALFGILFLSLDPIRSKGKRRKAAHLFCLISLAISGTLSFFFAGSPEGAWVYLFFFLGMGMERAMSLWDQRTYAAVFSSALLGIKLAHIHIGLGLIPSSLGCISFLYLLFIGVVFYDFAAHYRYLSHARAKLENDEIQVQRKKELALREEIKPHFVFHALSSIETSYAKGLKEGDEAVERFATTVRQGMLSAEKDLIPLDQEIANITRYLELENLRFPSRPYSLLIDVEDEGIPVPPLALQTFVENVVVHSSANQKGPAEIELSESMDEGKARIVILDQGLGFSSSAPHGTGVGMKNTIERWKLLLGAEVHIESRTGKGTIVVIDIPLKEEMK